MYLNMLENRDKFDGVLIDEAFKLKLKLVYGSNILLVNNCFDKDGELGIAIMIRSDKHENKLIAFRYNDKKPVESYVLINIYRNKGYTDKKKIKIQKDSAKPSVYTFKAEYKNYIITSACYIPAQYFESEAELKCYLEKSLDGLTEL